MMNWKKYKLGELYNVSSGLSKPRSEFGFGHPFVTFKDVFDNYFLPEKLSALANTTEKEIRSCSVKKGDIFLTRTSETSDELGMSSVALKDYENATFNGFTKRLRLKDDVDVEIDPLFIGYYLRSSNFRNQMYGHATMTTRASLNSTAINSLEIEIPNIKTQAAIGMILKSLDDKITLNRRMNQTLEQMAQTLFKKFCTSGNSVALNEQIELNPKLSLKKGETATYIEMGDLPETGSSINNTIQRPFNGGSKFQNGDTLFARITPCLENGKTAYVDVLKDGEVGFGSTEFIVMRPKEGISPYLPYFVARDENFRQYAIRSMTGTSGRQRVQTEMLFSYELSKCEPYAMKAFHEAVDPLFKQIKSNCQESKTLTSIRNTLLPKLLSGEISVNSLHQNQPLHEAVPC